MYKHFRILQINKKLLKGEVMKMIRNLQIKLGLPAGYHIRVSDN